MTKNKSKLIIIGSLFLIATASYLIGSSMLESIFNLVIEDKDINVSLATLGILLELINVVSVVAIGFLLSSILKQYNSKLSSVYLISRLIEGILLLISIASILPLIFNNTTITSPLDNINLYNSSFQIGMLSLGIGSIFLMVMFWKENIIPKSLSILGVVSYILLTVSSVFELTNVTSSFTMLLYLPGSIFEIVFPIWLIRKGVSRNESNSMQKI